MKKFCKLLNCKRKNEDGAMMLEALIVYGVTVTLLFLVLAIFMLLYQRWNIQTIANETATKIGQNYRYLNAGTDEYTGSAKSISDISKVSPFRYWFSDGVKNTASNEGSTHAKARLSSTSFVNNEVEPTVTVEIIKDSLARRHVKVTIKGVYRVPLGEIFDFFSLPSNISYETVGYADCVDIINYMNTVDFADTLLSKNLFGSEVYNAVNGVISLFDDIKDFINR